MGVLLPTALKVEYSQRYTLAGKPVSGFHNFFKKNFRQLESHYDPPPIAQSGYGVGRLASG